MIVELLRRLDVSKYGAEVKGKICTAAIVFGALGMNFQDPKAPYDASKYEGVTFFAKRGPGSTGKVRMKVPDQNTDGDAKVCSECFNDFGTDMQFSEDWKRYTFLFDRMKQEEGWGAPRPKRIDVKQIYGVQYQVKQGGAAYDIWIDDLAFVCQ
jgi:endoglucanase